MGNSWCGCSGACKEEFKGEKISGSLEEVVEFQSGLFSHSTVNPVIAANVMIVKDAIKETMEREVVGKVEEKILMQGELFRLQISLKEILVPRWCVLTNLAFKYYRSQYSALCKEKALVEIPLQRILNVKAYTSDNKCYIELSFSKALPMLSSTCSIASLNSGRASHSNQSRHRKTISSASTYDECLVFVTTVNKEFENWKKILKRLIKFN